MAGFMDKDKLHEECGVFGIYAREGVQIARDIYHGLIALQHRGQESAGISVSDVAGPKGNSMTKKGMGLVSEVFTPADLDALKGNLGVGHVRYSTTGGSIPENAQPITMRYIKGMLSLVYNGNLVNTDALKEKQMYRGQAHFTTSDSEVIAYEIVSARIGSDSIESAVLNAAKALKGGYALIVMSPKKLVALRDPFGIKPLIIGRREGAYIVASESAAIEAAGGEIMRDVEPGELITIGQDGIKSDRSLCGADHAHCVFEYIYFARADSRIDRVEVRDARVRAGKLLADKDNITGDIVVGVPDSGLLAAEGYAQASGIPFAIGFHKNSYIGRSFIKPSDSERQNAVHMKLSVLKSVVCGKRLVLIDDSIVRGTTMRQIIEMLKDAGAKEVHVRISSPPFLYPCYYGTDVPTAKQLIASEHSTEEVCRRIGADSLAYLQVEDLEVMAGGLNLCKACFDNVYPIDVSEEK